MIISNNNIQLSVINDTDISIFVNNLSLWCLYDEDNLTYYASKVFNINDILSSDINYTLSVLPNDSFTLTQNSLDDELYVISFTGNTIKNGVLQISYNSKIIEIPITVQQNEFS